MLDARRWVLTLFSLLLPLVALGQSLSTEAERGGAFFQEHYGPSDYHAHPQNWAVVQDQRGVIYVANYDGVLEYNGVSWRLIRTKNGTITRSLAVDSAGTVYVGVVGDFGYLAPDSLGRLEYRSLVEEAGLDVPDFADVWGVKAMPEGVYFQTHKYLFRWNGIHIDTWKTSGVFHTTFQVNGHLYLRESGRGLLEMVDDSLQLVPEGERFKRESVYVMATFDKDRILVGTRRFGLLLYDGNRFLPFETDADPYLATHRLYHGAALPGGFFALATLDNGGVVVLDRQGHIVQMLNESSGLPDGWVNYVFVDAQGGLWIALHNKGVVRADVASPLTGFDSNLGLDGLVFDIVRHSNRLNVATSVGLFVLDPGEYSLDSWRTARFRPLRIDQGEAVSVWKLVSRDDGLFAATNKGIYQISPRGTTRIFGGKSYSLVASSKYPLRIYAGTQQGVVVMSKAQGEWRVSGKLGTNGEEVFSLAEDSNGSLWVTTRQRNIYRFDLGSESIASAKARRISPSPALARSEIVLHVIDNQIVFASRGGFFEYHDESNQFSAYAPLDDIAAKDSLLAFSATNGGVIWMVHKDKVSARQLRSGVQIPLREPAELRFPNWSEPSRIYVEDGILWISSGNTLVRFDNDMPVAKPYDKIFPPLIRRIATVDDDRLIYGGALAGKDGRVSLGQNLDTMPVLNIGENALRFDFALPSYNDPAANEYQYYLEGKDEGWSEWTSVTHRHYTNLWEGTYQFHVRARNGQGFASPESVFTFRILPPWYRSWWAYGMYMMGLVALAMFGVRYRQAVEENRRAREQAKELEREREVNERLQEANARLTEIDRLKDEFLATTSHELRTPLTAILGFTAILQEELDEEHAEFISFIDENGHRLLHTVDSLLDLATLRAGVTEINPEIVDVGEYVARLMRDHRQHAERKHLDLTLLQPDAPAYGLLDTRCLETILFNLVDNGLKFTDDGGVTISVEQTVDRLAITVADTGCGIEARFLPHLFDEFRQASNGLTRSHEGSGLGLAITGRLVQLMNGEITVESELGVGTTFVVTFPSCQEGDSLPDSAQVTVSDSGLAP